MIKLSDILQQILQETKQKNFQDVYETIFFEDSRLFQELANPDFAYSYTKISDDIWEFNDKYGNILGVQFDPYTRYLDSYYKMKDLNGKEINVFDYDKFKNVIDPLSFQGGTDQHRSDTICKILRDEILPQSLLNKKPSVIKIHPINEYRHNIFFKCCEVCKEKYDNIEISQSGKEIYLINK